MALARQVGPGAIGPGASPGEWAYQRTACAEGMAGHQQIDQSEGAWLPFQFGLKAAVGAGPGLAPGHEFHGSQHRFNPLIDSGSRPSLRPQAARLAG